MEFCYARSRTGRLVFPHVLFFSFLLSLSYSSATVTMDNLPSGVHPDLPKSEFIQQLTHLPISELLSLRINLFNEASSNHSLVAPGFVNTPLVTRKDTAIKPASYKLSEDVWSLISCIRNMVPVPRTLFRNGKRSREFLTQVSQQSCTDDSISSTSISPTPPPSQSDSVCHTRRTPPSDVSSRPPKTQCNPPSSSDVANFFVTREINQLKDEVRSMKSVITTILQGHQTATTLMTIKRELASLREVVTTVSSQHSPSHMDRHAVSSQLNLPSVTQHANMEHLVITTWNCRGYSNAIPYLNKLIDNGTDVIALCEHWLWPFDLPKLNQLHPDYTGLGQSDKRLNDYSTLTRGCGGVGLIWKKSISASPVNIDSDRICGIQLELSECVLTVLCVYLPSSDHTIEEFTAYVNELNCAVCALQTQGPVLLAGDFNAHLPNTCTSPNQQGKLLNDLIDQNHLYPVSCSSIVSGPNYTYFSGPSTTTVDYIFLDVALSSYVNSCEVMSHHPLNLSDHLAVSVSVSIVEMKSTLPQPMPARINWSKAVAEGSIQCYANKVHLQLAPLLDTAHLSVSELDNEIKSVVNILIDAAQECLPFIKHSKKKFILDHKLSTLCKLSKIAWKRWKDAGRPNHGQTYTEKRDTRRAVKMHISACRAQKERSEIQKRDLLFKNKDCRRFRVFKSNSECSKLLDVNKQPVTDSAKILELFRSYFLDLASSDMHPDGPVFSAMKNLSMLEADSFTHEDQILDTDIVVEEIEDALKVLKLGRSKGADGLNSEHLLYGGTAVTLWLKKIFNTIISLEEIPSCLKEGVVVPIYKGKGKDPLSTSSYRGITLSSVIAKTLEVVILKRMSPVLDELGYPDIKQPSKKESPVLMLSSVPKKF